MSAQPRLHKLLVWTRFRAVQRDVWALVSDPAELSAAMPWWGRWELTDPEGLRRAWQGEGPVGRVFQGRLRFGLDDADPPMRCTVSGVDEHAGYLHRRRVERAVGERVRFVDEVLLGGEGAWWRAAARVEVSRRVLVAQHRALARRLPHDPDVVAVSRVYPLLEGDRGHLRDRLQCVDAAGEAPWTT